MLYAWWIAGVLIGGVWLLHAIDARIGMRSVADISRAEWDRPLEAAPRVSIIVPARNEEHTIEPAMRSLFALDYPDYEIVAVDDRSTDATGAVLDRLAGDRDAQGRLTVIHVAELPDGWLGKTHAMWIAAKRATGDWLLFTDADVLFHPDVVRRALAYVESKHADHLVLFPTMLMESFGEKMTMSFFQSMFVFGHRPWKVSDPESEDHAGVGAFNMVRRRAYEAVGTYERMRLAVIDDLKLGELVKKAGFSQRTVFGKDLIRLRWAEGAFGIVRNLTKNFFAYMRFSPTLAVLACVAVIILNVGPFVGVVFAPGWARVSFAIALICMLGIYRGMSRHSGIAPWYLLFHPVSTLLFCYTILRSTVLTLLRGGVVWRGTLYRLEELRKGMD